jgi:hypothetical protein
MIFWTDKDPLVYGIQAVKHNDYMCMPFTVYLYVLQLEFHLTREKCSDPNYLFFFFFQFRNRIHTWMYKVRRKLCTVSGNTAVFFRLCTGNFWHKPEPGFPQVCFWHKPEPGFPHVCFWHKPEPGFPHVCFWCKAEPGFPHLCFWHKAEPGFPHVCFWHKPEPGFPHVCFWHKPEPGFPASYTVVYIYICLQ